MWSVPLEPSRQSLEAMGQTVLSRVADIQDSLRQLPAGRARPHAGLVEQMQRQPPEQPGDLETLLDQFQAAAEQALDTAGPGYLAYFPAGGLVGSALAELLAQTYNRFTAVAELAPALVAMEDGVLRWLSHQFGLPPGAGGLITTGGSIATLVAVVAARQQRLSDDFTSGTVYVAEHTHFCVAKAARIAGFPTESIRTVPAQGLRMDPAAARHLIAADRAQGLRPFLLVGTAGTTSTGTIDPLPELAEVARQENLWFHVDAAYGGGFQLTDRGRGRLAGIERADSITFDPHKSLFLQYGTGVLLVREPRHLAAAHAHQGAYLQDLETVQGLPDYGHLGPELTREFRGLRLWLPLHLHGVEAFRDALDEKLELAELAYETLSADARFELPWAPDLTVVVFRLRGEDEPNRRLLELINATGRIFLSTTLVDGQYFLRLNATSHRTHAGQLRDALEIIQTCAGPAVRQRPQRT